MKSWQYALLECGEERLNQVAHLWGMDSTKFDKHNYPERMLLQRTHDPIAARFVWEYLTRDERQILYSSLSYSAREGLRREELQKKSQIAPEQYGLAIDNLLRNLVLYQQLEEISSGKRGHGNLPPRTTGNRTGQVTEVVPIVYPYAETFDALQKAGREIFTPLGDRSTQSLDQLLAKAHQGILYGIMNNYELAWNPYHSRSDFKTMVVEKLLELEEPLDYLPNLSSDARELYLWLREQGGRMLAKDARTHLHCNDATLGQILHELEDCVIAFDTFSQQERVLFIPHDVYAKLRPLSGHSTIEETQMQSNETEVIPQEIRTGETTILYDIAVVTNAIYQQTIEPTQAGRVPKRLFNKIRSLLGGIPRVNYDYEDDYLEILLEVMQEFHLVQLNKVSFLNNKEHYGPGARLAWWSELDGTQQATHLLTLWIDSMRWREASGVNYIPWDPYAWQPLPGRRLLLKYLKERTAGRWYTISSLLQDIWNRDPFVLHPQQAHMRRVERKKTRDVREKWFRCDGEIYIGMLTGTLHELGIVSLGYDHSRDASTEGPRNPDAFMLTEFGAAILSIDLDKELSSTQNADTTDTADTAHTLIVQPSFELLLLQPDFPTLYSVLPFVQVNQIGLASRLTLTRISVLHGLEKGQNVEQIMKALEDHSQKELPQNVVYTLNDWVKQYKEVNISQVYLFKTSSDDIADEICSSPRLQKLLAGAGLRKIAPCMLVLSCDISLPELKRMLEKEGITLHLSGNIITRQNRYSPTYDLPL